MKCLIVIPSRYGSSRFPGKPLALVNGISLIQRVWSIATSVAGNPRVIVATDDSRIQDAIQLFGGEVVMTSLHCPNGSMRVCEVLDKLPEQFDVVVNLQGDAPLVPPWVVQELIDHMASDPAVTIATPAVQLTQSQYKKLLESKLQGIVSGTTVTFDRNNNALYFSKAVLPFFKKTVTVDPVPVYQHIGLYAYRPSALREYVTLPEGQFEAVEDLEQLRALENGMDIRVVQVSLRGRTLWPIDNPEDLRRVEEVLVQEGELVL